MKNYPVIMGIIISHYKDPGLNNQDSMESKSFFCFLWLNSLLATGPNLLVLLIGGGLICQDITCEFKGHLMHSLKKRRGASLGVWSFGVFLPPSTLRTTKLCISNLSACNCDILSQPYRSVFRLKISPQELGCF